MTGTGGPRLARAGAVGGAVVTAVAGLVAAVLLVGGDRASAPACLDRADGFVDRNAHRHPDFAAHTEE